MAVLFAFAIAPKWLKESFLRRFIIIRRDLEGAISASLFGRFCEVDGFVGRIGTRACDDFYFTFRKFDSEPDDSDMLLKN